MFKLSTCPLLTVEALDVNTNADTVVVQCLAAKRVLASKRVLVSKRELASKRVARCQRRRCLGHYSLHFALFARHKVMSCSLLSHLVVDSLRRSG